MMNETNSNELEAQLHALAQTQKPDVAFAEQLEQRLLAAHVVKKPSLWARVFKGFRVAEAPAENELPHEGVGVFRPKPNWSLASLLLLAVLVLAGGLVFTLSGFRPAPLGGPPQIAARSTALPTKKPTARPTFAPTSAATTLTGDLFWPTVVFSVTPASYVVQPGDTCIAISQKFNINFADLMSLNQLDQDCVIQIGQQLAIPNAAQPPVIVPLGTVPPSVKTSPALAKFGDIVALTGFTHTPIVRDGFVTVTVNLSRLSGFSADYGFSIRWRNRRGEMFVQQDSGFFGLSQTSQSAFQVESTLRTIPQMFIPVQDGYAAIYLAVFDTKSGKGLAQVNSTTNQSKVANEYLLTEFAIVWPPTNTAQIKLNDFHLSTSEAAAGDHITASVQLTQPAMRCQGNWFFNPHPQGCLTSPITKTFAAVQVFEGGRMFWFQHSQTIVVLYEAHGFSSGAQTFIDTYADGTPEADPNVIAPEGKQQPRRGFGWVWRNYPSVRQRLGWALQPEQGFNTCIAITDAQDAFNNTYFADHTGRLVQLMGTRDSGYYSWSMPAFQNGVAVKVTCNP